MAILHSGVGKYQDINDDDYRAYLITRNQEPIVYHSQDVQFKRLQVHMRSAFGRIDRFLHWLSDVIIKSQHRKIQRELAMRGLTSTARRMIAAKALRGTIAGVHRDRRARFVTQRRAAGASITGPLLGKAGAVLSRFATTIWLGARERYHPEDHYMRGPGPKWREKHGLSHAEPGVAGPAVDSKSQTSTLERSLPLKLHSAAKTLP